MFMPEINQNVLAGPIIAKFGNFQMKLLERTAQLWVQINLVRTCARCLLRCDVNIVGVAFCCNNLLRALSPGIPLQRSDGLPSI